MGQAVAATGAGAVGGTAFATAAPRRARAQSKTELTIYHIWGTPPGGTPAATPHPMTQVIDAFNAQMIAQRRALTLAEVLQQQDDTHQQLIALVHSIPDDQIARETRARRRLRLDTYSHYPIHTTAIRAWRSIVQPDKEYERHDLSEQTRKT